jgi:hypothetical protein
MPRQVLHPHAQCYFRFHQCRGLRTNSRPARRRPAPRGPLQQSTADAVGGRGQADFVTDRVIIHPSCRLIGRYRSIPSCNRPTFLRLVRLLTVLIIAASAMCQTKSLVTNGPIERSVGMNAALSVAAPCAFVPVLRQGRSSDTRTRSATVATHRRKYAAELTTEWCL